MISAVLWGLLLGLVSVGFINALVNFLKARRDLNEIKERAEAAAPQMDALNAHPDDAGPRYYMVLRRSDRTGYAISKEPVFGAYRLFRVWQDRPPEGDEITADSLVWIAETALFASRSEALDLFAWLIKNAQDPADRVNVTAEQERETS